MYKILLINVNKKNERNKEAFLFNKDNSSRFFTKKSNQLHVNIYLRFHTSVIFVSWIKNYTKTKEKSYRVFVNFTIE